MAGRIPKGFVSGLVAAFGVGLLLPMILWAMQPPAPHSAIEAGGDHNEMWWSEDAFRIVAHTADLPASVKKAFPDSSRQSRGFRMADPGQPWDAGCIRGKLPAQRLIFAGVSKDHCFVYFMGGGIDTYCGIAVFRLSGNTARFVGTRYVDWAGGHHAATYPDWKTLQGAVRGKALEPRE